MGASHRPVSTMSGRWRENAVEGEVQGLIIFRVTVLIVLTVIIAGCGGGGGGTSPQASGPVTVSGTIDTDRDRLYFGSGRVQRGVISIYRAGHVGDSSFCVATTDVEFRLGGGVTASQRDFQLIVSEGGVYDLRFDFATWESVPPYWTEGYLDRSALLLTPPSTDLGTITSVWFDH